MNKNILKILGLSIVVVILAAVSLYFGIGFLTGQLAGSDSPHAASHVDYFYQHGPQKMLWQPLYGRGMSLKGTSYGGFWVTAMTAKILGLTPIQATQLWQWLNMFLASLGVFLLGWVLIGYLGGVFAGFFFLLSEMSWFWQSRVGLFEFQGALVWFPLFFVCFHLLLTSINKKNLFKKYIYLFFSSIILCIAFWWHLVIGALIIEASFLYMLFFFLKNRPPILKRLVEWGKVVGFGILLSSLFLIPFFFYNSRILEGKITYFTQENLPLLPWMTFWGFKSWDKFAYDMWQAYFALPVIIFALLGAGIALLKRNALVLLIFAIALFSSFQVSDSSSFITREALLPFFALLNVRAILIAAIFLPIAAGFGASKLGDLILFKFRRRKIKLILSFVLSILAIGFVLKNFDRVPVLYDSRCGSSYGPAGEGFCTDVDDLIKNLKFVLKPHGGFFEEPFLRSLDSLIENKNNTGADITRHRGRYVGEWALVSKVPILQSYDYVVPILFQSYSGEALYRKGDKEEVKQIASWFGLDYLILDSLSDINIEVYDDWQKLTEPDTIVMAKAPNPTGLGSHSSRPVVIFFGDNHQDAYFKWWQMLINGGLDYEDAFIVNGGDVVDKFSLDELSKFDAIFLWGESYKKTDKAFELIKKYLDNGGKVIIDTGWQYTSPFWQEEELPDWMPITKTHWYSFNEWELEAKDVDLDVDVSGWTVPKWDGKSWGASTAKVEDLRTGAQAYLVDKSSNAILLAGMKVGKGEVIWTGLNLMGMYQMNDLNAVKLSNFLLKHFLESDVVNYPYEFNRIGPEKLIFELADNDNPTWLYWREASFPSWRTKSNGQPVEIYKGGPGMMLLYLPPHTTRLELYHGYHWTVILGISISLLALILLLLVMILSYQPKKKNIPLEE